MLHSFRSRKYGTITVKESRQEIAYFIKLNKRVTPDEAQIIASKVFGDQDAEAVCPTSNPYVWACL